MQDSEPPFFVVAGLYLTIGVLAVAGRLTVDAGVVEALPRLRWVTIHLVTIGAMTQALFGALPHLVRNATGGSDAPTRWERWSQWVLLNAGYPLVLVGMASVSTLTAIAGATLVLAALGLLLYTAHRLGGSGRIARFYRVAPWFLVVGISAAFGLLLNLHGPGGYFGSLEAHVHANVWGFLAIVVAGTLLTLVPARTGVDLPYPRLVPVTFLGLTLGAGGLVAGPWLARHELTFLGLAVYLVGTLALLANVVGSHRAAGSLRDTRLAHTLGAYLWLAFPVPWAPFVLLFPELVPGPAIERAAIDGLVFGWMLQLAMAYLPDVLAGVYADRDVASSLADSPASGAGWVQVVAVNLGVLALWVAAAPVLGGATETFTLAGYGLVGVAWTLFVATIWRTVSGGARTVTASA